MAVDLRGNPWKFDTAAQGEGKANSETQMLVGALTVTNATELFTLTAHGLVTGQVVQLAGTTAPTGTAKLTDYWVIWVSADTFKLATTRANALAGTNLTISDDGTTVTLTRFPLFDIPIYVKNIMIIGDGANDGTVEVLTKSGGVIIARAEIFSAATGVEANVRTPIYDYVEGIYIGTLDAANAIVLVYHGKP